MEAYGFTQVLSTEELEKGINSGQIPSELLSITFFAKNYDPAALIKSRPPASVRVSFYNSTAGNPFVYESFFLSDQFLIRCGKQDEGHRLSFIPLRSVDSCELVLKSNWTGYLNPITGKEKKSPAAGAVVGGIIAGAPGAVVGAALNSGEKEVTYVKGRTTSADFYNLVIHTTDGRTHVTENMVIVDHGLKKAEKKESEIKEKNRIAKMLIDRAKNPNKKTISNTRNEELAKKALKQERDEEISNLVSKVVGVAGMIIFALILYFLFSRVL